MKIRFSLTGLFALCLLYLSLSATYSYASDYYVSPDGNDSWPGNITHPWKHVKYATCNSTYYCPDVGLNPNALKAGDTLYLRNGTYNEYNIRFKNSGTAGNPITVKAYPGETPVVDTGFTDIPGGSYYSNSSECVFYIDGKHYITIDGLTLRRGRRALIYLGENNPTTNIIIQNCDLKDTFVFDNSGPIRINSYVDDISIINNKLHDNSQCCCQTWCSGAGIHIFGGGNISIINNEIYNVWEGIQQKNSQYNGKVLTIRNNKLSNIYNFGMQISRSNSDVRNNIIYNVTNGPGIRVFEASGVCSTLISRDNSIIHNTIVDIYRGIVLDQSDSCEGAVNTIIKDNIIYNFLQSDQRGLSVWRGSSTDNSNTTFTYNLIYSLLYDLPIRVLTPFYNISTCPLSICTNNIQQGPIFVDYANKNFALTPNSPGYRAASDGTDMGADVSLVGINPTGIDGDLNSDGKVSIADIQLCIKVILNQLDPISDAEIIQKAKELAAPYDAATIKDIQEIIRIILGG